MLLLALALPAMALAQGPPASPPAAPAPPAKQPAAQEGQKDIYLDHADRIRVNNRTHDVEVTGAVALRHEDARFFADLIRFNTQTKLGTATGNLRFQDRETTITGSQVNIDFRERRAAFVGNVVMVTQKQPEAAALEGKQPAAPPREKAGNHADEDRPLRSYREQKSTITCSRLEYSYRDKQAVASGGVKAVQRDRTAYGDKAVYSEQEDTLLITGNVRVENTKGETFRCDRVLISLGEDWLEAQGGVASHFLVKDEEEPKAPAGAIPSTPAKKPE